MEKTPLQLLPISRTTGLPAFISGVWNWLPQGTRPKVDQVSVCKCVLRTSFGAAQFLINFRKVIEPYCIAGVRVSICEADHPEHNCNCETRRHKRMTSNMYRKTHSAYRYVKSFKGSVMIVEFMLVVFRHPRSAWKKLERRNR